MCIVRDSYIIYDLIFLNMPDVPKTSLTQWDPIPEQPRHAQLLISMKGPFKPSYDLKKIGITVTHTTQEMYLIEGGPYETPESLKACLEAAGLSFEIMERNKSLLPPQLLIDWKGSGSFPLDIIGIKELRIESNDATPKTLILTGPLEIPVEILRKTLIEKVGGQIDIHA